MGLWETLISYHVDTGVVGGGELKDYVGFGVQLGLSEVAAEYLMEVLEEELLSFVILNVEAEWSWPEHPLQWNPKDLVGINSSSSIRFNLSEILLVILYEYIKSLCLMIISNYQL